jgi:hypothetical protein
MTFSPSLWAQRDVPLWIVDKADRKSARRVLLPGSNIGAPTLMLRIRERAYHIWAANGGDADQNWFCAEAEIVNTSAVQPPEAQSQKKQLDAATRRKAKKTASLG